MSPTATICWLGFPELDDFSMRLKHRLMSLNVAITSWPSSSVFVISDSQCRLYASELADKIPSVLEVFAFAIVEVGDEFYRELKQTNYKDIFSLKERVVYQDFKIGSKDSIPLHLYVMPVEALIKDAKARNRVFEEVLRFNIEKS